jgi:hypothetical protein
LKFVVNNQLVIRGSPTQKGWVNDSSGSRVSLIVRFYFWCFLRSSSNGQNARTTEASCYDYGFRFFRHHNLSLSPGEFCYYFLKEIYDQSRC